MVRIASASNAQNPAKSNGDVSHAREFLKAGVKVRKSAVRNAAEAYEKMVDDSSVYVHGQKKACTVRTALAKRDDTFLTIVEDMLPTAAGSQDVLKVCLTQASLEQTK